MFSGSWGFHLVSNWPQRALVGRPLDVSCHDVMECSSIRRSQDGSFTKRMGLAILLALSISRRRRGAKAEREAVP